MDSVSPEDAKSSSDDADKNKYPHAYADDAGTGRFYECVFCKRGFTTAQALGGHMNIHRRDKARNKQPSSSPLTANLPMDEYSRSGVLHPSGHSLQGQTYFAVSESSVGEAAVRKPWPLSLFEENPQMNLSLNIGTSDVEEKREAKRKEEEDGEVDLTLRLGHDP